jgi:hypothetical protein
MRLVLRNDDRIAGAALAGALEARGQQALAVAMAADEGVAAAARDTGPHEVAKYLRMASKTVSAACRTQETSLTCAARWKRSCWRGPGLVSVPRRVVRPYDERNVWEGRGMTRKFTARTYTASTVSTSGGQAVISVNGRVCRVDVKDAVSVRVVSDGPDSYIEITDRQGKRRRVDPECS